MRRLLTPGWLALHVVAIVLVLAFLRLGWWQWERATSPLGGMRSYGYALQWPVFALFVVFMWVKMVRDDLKPGRPDDAEDEAPDVVPPAAETGASAYGAAVDVEEDGELAAYNRYLAGLNARANREHQHQ